MPARDLPLLIQAARAAGQLMAGYAGGQAERWEKPGGAGPVTEADIAVNDLLIDQLRGARPDYGWLSEESEDTTDRLGAARVFIIDPIDGTRSFIDGSNTWAHSIAVAENGIVTAAVIYLPLRGKLYAAAAGQGATLNDRTIHTSDRGQLSGAQVLASKPTDNAQNWQEGVPDYTRGYRPSLAYRLGLVAEGRFDAMLTLRKSWEWDIAAGDLILREAGALASDRRSQPLRFNNHTPLLDGVVAANPALHAAITEALA